MATCVVLCPYLKQLLLLSSWAGTTLAIPDTNSLPATTEGGPPHTPEPQPEVGATDVRLNTSATAWSDPESLRSRILVAGGRRGRRSHRQSGAVGNIFPKNAKDGGQTRLWLPWPSWVLRDWRFGALPVGGGRRMVWGLQSDHQCPSTNGESGGGGSSYISGHPDCVGVLPDGSHNTTPHPEYGLSLHPSGLVFTGITVTPGVCSR